MTKIVKIMSYILFVVGMLLFYLFPTNKYEWMQELDPSITASSIESPSGNSVVFTLLLLILIVAAQIIVCIKSNNMKERVISIVLMLTAVIFWVCKFAL